MLPIALVTVLLRCLVIVLLACSSFAYEKQCLVHNKGQE